MNGLRVCSSISDRMTIFVTLVVPLFSVLSIKQMHTKASARKFGTCRIILNI